MKIYKNPLATAFPTNDDKIYAYSTACLNGAVAHRPDYTTVPLKTLKPAQVEFIGGLWRVQTPCDYNVQNVRGKDLIIGARLPHQEKTFFEYYEASLLAFNCYGPLKPCFDSVVAKYTTDNGTYWSYGRNISDARAFLGIRLYDEYMDLIHSVACQKTAQKSK
ncbi:MAG TPA: hypothetical protein DD611_03700 [Alphaproteobacteria bacterium]|nr:hypothetical protein [Alphaproteobacteria bacterium]